MDAIKYDGKLTQEELQVLRESSVSERKIKIIEEFLTTYKEQLTGLSDVVGDSGVPSELFYVLTKCLGYLLKDNPREVSSSYGVALRRLINPIIKIVGPSFLSNPQVIENRNYLRAVIESDEEVLPDVKGVLPDEEIVMPKDPVIVAPNHYFKDDVVASIVASKRYSHLVLGSLPQFFNTMDGLTAWLNGVTLLNRKVRSSSKAVIPKVSKMMLAHNADVVMFPEAVWNKTPNKLMIDFWHGIYVVSRATGCKVMPMVHYIADPTWASPDNPIHTVLDDPIKIDDLSEKAALELLRDYMSYWLMAMMKAYGQRTRESLLMGYNDSTEAWEDYLGRRLAVVDRYDSEIERNAHFRRKDIVDPVDVFEPILDTGVDAESKQEIEAMVLRLKREKFQERF